MRWYYFRGRYLVKVAPPLLSADTAVLLVATLVNLYMVVGDEGDCRGA